MKVGQSTSPVNAMPPVVVALALVIVGIEIIFQIGARGYAGAEAIGWRLAAVQDYAFSAPILQWMIETGRWQPEHIMRLATYPFVHLSFTHAAMVTVFLLALGKLVGEVFGTVAVLIVFFGSAIIGAASYGLILGDSVPLVGGYPAVYGFIGSYTFMMWLSYGHAGKSRLNAFQLIGFLVGVQLLFGLIFGGGRTWFADLSGFAAGFAMSFLLAPGAVARLRDKLRQR